MKKDFLVTSVLSALYFVVLSLMLLEVRIHSLLEKLPYFYVKKKIALSSASLRTLSSSFQLNSFPHHPEELAIFSLKFPTTAIAHCNTEHLNFFCV